MEIFQYDTRLVVRNAMQNSKNKVMQQTCMQQQQQNETAHLKCQKTVCFYWQKNMACRSTVVCIVSKEAHSIICSGRRRRNTPSTRNSTARRVQTRDKETCNSTPHSKHRSKNTRAASKHLLSLQKKKKKTSNCAAL